MAVFDKGCRKLFICKIQNMSHKTGACSNNNVSPTPPTPHPHPNPGVGGVCVCVGGGGGCHASSSCNADWLKIYHIIKKKRKFGVSDCPV